MKPEIRIFKNLESLSHAAAELFIQQAAQAVHERSRFLVALNGGNTPAPLFHLLATDYHDKVDWSKVHIFWGDERCVPSDDAESSYGQAWDLFLRHVPIAESNVHRIKTDIDPVEASREYSLTLKRFATPALDWPRFDVVYLGMGEDASTWSISAWAKMVILHRSSPARRWMCQSLLFPSPRNTRIALPSASH
jgi:6-phosphogluconolactonase